MIGRACVVRSLTALFLLSVATTAAPQSDWAKKLTLPQLLDMARGNPGLQATDDRIIAHLRGVYTVLRGGLAPVPVS